MLHRLEEVRNLALNSLNLTILFSYSYKTSYEAKIIKTSEQDVVVFN